MESGTDVYPIVDRLGLWTVQQLDREELGHVRVQVVTQQEVSKT